MKLIAPFAFATVACLSVTQPAVPLFDSARAFAELPAYETAALISSVL